MICCQNCQQFVADMQALLASLFFVIVLSAWLVNENLDMLLVWNDIDVVRQLSTSTATILWYSGLSGTTRVSRYPKKHSPTHTYRGHQSSLICFLHLLRSMASSLFNLRAWKSFSTISLQVFFGLPLGLAPSTSYSTHFLTESLSSFCSTCPYHCTHNLKYSTKLISKTVAVQSLYLIL